MLESLSPVAAALNGDSSDPEATESTKETVPVSAPATPYEPVLAPQPDPTLEQIRILFLSGTAWGALENLARFNGLGG